jgi:hypothetical protein
MVPRKEVVLVCAKAKLAAMKRNIRRTLCDCLWSRSWTLLSRTRATGDEMSVNHNGTVEFRF